MRTPFRLRAGWIGCQTLAALTVTTCPRHVTAQQTLDSTAAGWLDQQTMTGDWDGERTRLETAGVNLRAHFTTESAGNLTGGLYQTARYTQQIDVGVDLDLGRLAAIDNATIQITMTQRDGRSLSADAIGNQFAVQELYGAGQNFRLAEMNYQQFLLDHMLNIQLGWSPVGDYFASFPTFCDFQNGVICGHANAMTTNSGAHNFPTGQWGARFKVSPTPEMYVQTGLYQVNPNAGDSDKGFDLSFDSTGAFIPLELGWLPGQSEGALPGIYKAGAYLNTSNTPDVLTDINGMSAGLTGAPFAERDGRWGTYAMADQTVYREASDSKRGLRIGSMIGEGDATTAKYRYFIMAGGVYQGTFSHRDDDFVSFMVAYVRTNHRLTQYQEDVNNVSAGTVGVQTYEAIAEVDYGWQLAPWLSIRPNLQYVERPGGTGKIPNALVVGLYTKVTL